MAIKAFGIASVQEAESNAVVRFSPDAQKLHPPPPPLVRGVGGIKLPQLGWLEVRWSRRIPEIFQVKQARIVRKASGYFVLLSLQADVEVPDVMPHGHPVGIDVGLEYFLSSSDGEPVKRPRFFEKLHRKLKSTSDPAPSHGARERASCYNAD
ncbi:hypothetical protein [Baaleninema simplex]|uniref:hypothetical protein n=1 Tax=Baaleninema simplex TaxID=2862350 RepID=UPI001FDF76A9|nr:hypothetical protein [Baaleninema simplex]